MQKKPSNPVVTKIQLRLTPDFRKHGQRQELAPKILVYPRDTLLYASRNSNANYMEHLLANSWGSANLGMRGR